MLPPTCIHVLKNKNICDVLTHWHAHKPTTFFLWEVLQVQTLALTQGCKGQTVCFSRFTPYYLFMKQRGRDGESQQGRETKRNPPARGLWCGKQNLLFNLPFNRIHMTHPEFVCQFFTLQFVCVCMFYACARVQHRTRLRQHGGGWTKKILVIAPCCCSIALPEK